MKIFLIHFVFLLLIACNVQNSETDICFKINVIVKNDDTFQLFYNDSYIENYTELNSVTQKVIGNTKLQEISFKIPKGFKLKRIRLDLGNNINQNEIILKTISINSKKSKILFNENQILNDFRFNEDINYDTLNKKIVFKNEDKIYDPYLISKNLTPIIDKL